MQDFENQSVLIINKDLTYTCCISPKETYFHNTPFPSNSYHILKKKIGIYHGTKINGVNLSNMIHLVIALISHSIHAWSLMCSTCIPTKLDAIIHIIEFFLLKSNEIQMEGKVLTFRYEFWGIKMFFKNKTYFNLHTGTKKNLKIELFEFSWQYNINVAIFLNWKMYSATSHFNIKQSTNWIQVY